MSNQIGWMACFYCSEEGATGIATGTPTIDGAGLLTIPLDGVAFITCPNFNEFYSIGPLASYSPKSVRWVCFQSVKITADLGVADGEYIFGAFRRGAGGYFLFSCYRNALNTWRLRVRTNTTPILTSSTLLFTGTTDLSFNVAYRILGSTDGTTCRGDVNETQEGSAATTALIDKPTTADTCQFGSITITAGGVNCVLGPVAYTDSDTLAEKPQMPNMAAGEKHTATGTPTTGCDQWGVNTGTKWGATDDYASGDSNGDTDRIENVAPDNVSGTFRQTMKTAALNLDNPSAVQQLARIAFTSSTKTLTGKSLQANGTTYQDGPARTLADTNYHFDTVLYNADADGNPWTQARLDLLEIGRVSVIGADAVNQKCTAIMAEVLSLPFASTATRRRAGPALGSANMMVA